MDKVGCNALRGRAASYICPPPSYPQDGLAQALTAHQRGQTDLAAIAALAGYTQPVIARDRFESFL